MGKLCRYCKNWTVKEDFPVFGICHSAKFFPAYMVEGIANGLVGRESDELAYVCSCNYPTAVYTGRNFCCVHYRNIYEEDS